MISNITINCNHQTKSKFKKIHIKDFLILLRKGKIRFELLKWDQNKIREKRA